MSASNSEEVLFNALIEGNLQFETTDQLIAAFESQNPSAQLQAARHVRVLLQRGLFSFSTMSLLMTNALTFVFLLSLLFNR